MNTTATSRFSIAKDLGEYIAKHSSLPWGDLSGSDEKNWKYHYEGDADILPFMNLYEEEVQEFAKFYPDMDIWLKNIHWKWLFENARKLLDALTTKITKPWLIIVHAFPLEMVIAWEVLKTLGVNNTVYNFNRVPSVNSNSKTLEATLFSTAWKQISWLESEVNTLAAEYKNHISSTITRSIFLFTENDSTPSWNITHVDPYIKNAIGFKENTVIYRIHDFPESSWLLQKWIHDIYSFDSDNSRKIDSFYKHSLEDIFSFHTETYKQYDIDSIGFYEDYVALKNTEYHNYKQTILTKNQALVGSNGLKGTVSSNSGWLEKWKKWNTWNTSPRPLSALEVLTYAGWLALLIPIIIVLASKWWAPFLGWSSSSSSSSSYGWNSIIFGWWGGSSTIGSSSSKSSSSTISSFWWGGFSKGSSSGG